MIGRKPYLAIFFVLLCACNGPARAYDALQACRAHSLLLTDIHACLDNYLDLIDQNLEDLTIFIDGELEGPGRAAFGRAQNSFYGYRRENCLWYLEISGTRDRAEQVAKNCMAEMSQQRLAELQGLIASYQNGAVPKPDVAKEPKVEELAAAKPVTPKEAPKAPEPQPAPKANELSAFFGQWEVSCNTKGNSKRCSMEVPLNPIDGKSSGSTLYVTRRGNELSSVELRFPGKPLNAPENVSWRVDNYSFGAVPGSIVRNDGDLSRQVINERKFVREDLLPLFRGGSEVGITLQAKGSAGQRYEATLVGFSKALNFADQFIDGKLQ